MTVDPFDGAGFTRRLEEVRARVASARGDVTSVRIVAVTKGFGPEAVEAALDAGLTEIGENYADDLVAKSLAVGAGRGRCGTSSVPCSGTRLAAWPRW